MKKRIGLIIAVVLVLLFCFLPAPEGLTPEGMRSLGIFLGTIALFVFQSMPMSIVCIVIMSLTPWFGIGNLNQVMLDFGGMPFFFLLFTFILMHAIAQTSIPQRIVSAVLRLTKGNSTGILFGIMFVATFISAVMANFGTLLLVLSVVMPMLKEMDCKPGESGLGRCLLLGIPLACCVGGMITPAGMPGNVIAQNILEAAGFSVSFGKWTVVCLPLALVSMLAICFALKFLFKPEVLDQERIKQVLAKDYGPMKTKEIYIIVVYAACIVCWFLSTWVPAFNIVNVAACGTFLMFIPGFECVDWKKFASTTNWDVLFVVGAVGVTLGCITTTGALTWVVNKFVGSVSGLSPFMLMFIMGIACCVIRVALPVGPAVPAILCPIMLAVAASTGANPVAMAMLPVIAASYPLLLTYTEAIYLYTMPEGYYKPFDLDKFGIPLNIILCLVCALYFPAVFG